MFRFLLAGLLALGVCLADRRTGDITRQVEERYNSARTLSVRFVEEYEVEGRRRPPESGTLVLQKQGKMRWNYAQPAGKLVVSDGKSIYLYTAGDNRVEKVPIRDTEDMRAPLAFLLGRLDFQKEFTNIQAHGGADGVVLDAAAKSPNVPYEKVQMLLDPDGVIRRLTVTGRDGSIMTFSFIGEQLNPHLDSAMFHFTVPPGAEVVDSVDFKAEGR